MLHRTDNLRAMKQNQPATPLCPVPRCGTKRSHKNNPTVQAFMRQTPAEVIDWTKRCIVEVIQSVIDDVNKGRIFAYLTRWRDPEELYTRVLYAMFVALAEHLPHIFSGDMPNGIAALLSGLANDGLRGVRAQLPRDNVAGDRVLTHPPNSAELKLSADHGEPGFSHGCKVSAGGQSPQTKSDV